MPENRQKQVNYFEVEQIEFVQFTYGISTLLHRDLHVTRHLPFVAPRNASKLSNSVFVIPFVLTSLELFNIPARTRHHSTHTYSISNISFRNVRPSGAELRPPASEKQLQVLPQSRRQLPTLGTRLGWDGRHNGELEREDQHHGAAGV
jgi:hypothetical protein